MDARLATATGLGISDLADTIDFTLAFALVHELPNPDAFFQEVANASKANAGLLFVEPSGHVQPDQFEAELQAAVKAGFELASRPTIRRSHAAFLQLRLHSPS